MSQRPNILLITSDQQRWDTFGLESRRCKTPHLDRLARNGTRFSSCITPNVVCQPSRASMLTGLLPLSHGVADNGINLEPAVGKQGFSGQLAGNGYDTAFIGKAHFASKGCFEPSGTPECKHSSADYGEDWNGPYMGFDHVELMVHGHFDRIKEPLRPPLGQHFERWFFSRGTDDEAWQLWSEELQPPTDTPQTWHSALPVQWHSSTWMTDRAIDWIARRKGDEPFCAWVSLPDPHHPFDCPEPWSRLHHPDEVDLPAHRTRDLDRRPWWHKATLEGEPAMPDPEAVAWRKHGSRVPPLSDAQLRRMTANYFGMISLVDHSVGRILDALDAQGVADNTIVVFTTDHGDLLGDHGLYLKGPTMYEALLRIGLIVAGPGVPADRVVQDPVSTVDLAATFLDYGNTECPAHWQSESLRPLIEARAGASRDVAYNEWRLHEARCGVPLELRTIRTKIHKCTFELDSGAGELYDLANDPMEMNNLYDDSGYRAVRNELEDMMRARPGPLLNKIPDPVGSA